MGSIGEKSVKILLTSLSVILLLASIFALILIILNYRLRKTAMEYQYKAQDSRKVRPCNSRRQYGAEQLGKAPRERQEVRKALQILPERPSESKAIESKSTENPCGGSIPRPADLET